MARRDAIGRLPCCSQPWVPVNPVLRGVSLGTAVCIWLPGRGGRGSVQEGVVMAVVPPGLPVPVAVSNDIALCGWRKLVPHYVVQCTTARVLRRASEMDVVSL